MNCLTCPKAAKYKSISNTQTVSSNKKVKVDHILLIIGLTFHRNISYLFTLYSGLSHSVLQSTKNLSILPKNHKIKNTNIKISNNVKIQHFKILFESFLSKEKTMNFLTERRTFDEID
jgi:hypothetical protein